jgi:ABC-2 type transport system permease protein
MSKIAALLRKEWLELRSETILVFTVFGLPLIFTMLPIVMVMSAVSTSVRGNISGTFMVAMTRANPELALLPPYEQVLALVPQTFGMLILTIPIFVPSMIAAYSIVGEKMRRTLEPLLATALTTRQLILGKIGAAFIPAVLIAWICGGLYVVSMRMILPPTVFGFAFTSAWWLLLVVAAPLLSLLTIALTVLVSARVNDPRTAQQVSAFLILPISGFMMAQLFGVVALNTSIALYVIAALCAVCCVVLWLAVRAFQRESILTRWR